MRCNLTAVREAQSTFEDTVTWLKDCRALPDDVDTKARLLLLDTFGCILAGLRHGEVRQFARALAAAFPGDVQWPGSDVRLGPAGAAALGAAAACWDEACEGNAQAHGRPGLPVVPCLLALAAQRNATLGDLLLALATGYEVGARAGEAWRIPAGLHVDGSWHSLAAAAGTARFISGGDAIGPAIEAAACQIPASLYLPITVGSVVRNAYVAHAALLGLLAAATAEAKFVSPTGALEEARRRVLRASEPARVTPAGEWMLRDGYLKLYAGVRHTHYGVEAALRLRARHAFALDDIRAITLTIYEEAIRYCGNRAPRSAIQAQFSLSYAIAAALRLGDLGPDAYDVLTDPAVSRLEQRVTISPDPTRAGRGAHLAIEAGTQTFSEDVDAVLGDPARPMTASDIVGKFLRYAQPTLDQARAAAVVRLLTEGGHEQPVAHLFTLKAQ